MIADRLKVLLLLGEMEILGIEVPEVAEEEEEKKRSWW